jgi:hypothetical protein
MLTPPLVGEVAITSGFCLSGYGGKKIEKRGNYNHIYILILSLLYPPFLKPSFLHPYCPPSFMLHFYIQSHIGARR